MLKAGKYGMKSKQLGFSILWLAMGFVSVSAIVLVFLLLKPSPESLALQYIKNIVTPSYMTRNDINTNNCPLGKCPAKELELEYPEGISDTKAWSDFHQSLLTAGYTKTKQDVNSDIAFYDYSGKATQGTCDVLHITHSSVHINSIEVSCWFTNKQGNSVYKNPPK